MNKYKKYCTGCGLCKSLNICNLEQDEKGFYHPSKENDLFGEVCPVSGTQTVKLDETDIWGRNEAVYLGWSNNDHIRTKASSGGILTEIASFLLISKKVDVVIHTDSDPDNPIKTKIYFSKTPKDVASHCGSRYCISSPLSVIDQIEDGKKYAFIGKPCDIVTLRNYMELKPELNEAFPYLLSFFCMGLPSDEAQKKLLNKLECDDCVSLDYRGNGWPGFATAVDKSGVSHQITYDESWGKILGRDLMLACKICIDGIGEMADISCGDAWYLTEDKKPDFSEHAGRNVIFARTSKGNELLQEMRKQRLVTLNMYTDYKDELPLIQTSQWNRRREMRARLLAMKVLKQDYPSYEKSILKQFSKELSFKQHLRVFFGTLKRILKGKM